MNITIKLAETASEMDQLFQLRHTVYVAQDGYFDARPDRRVFDRYDALPTTLNFVVKHGDYVLGGARYTESSMAGTSAQEFFDFAPFLPAGPIRWGSGSMLCLSKELRGTPIAQTLLNMGYAAAVRRGWRCIVTVANPKVELLFRRHGWRSLTSTLFDDHHKLPFVAMMVRLDELRGSSRRFVDEYHAMGKQESTLELPSSTELASDHLPKAEQARIDAS